ncbi:hypothetical protein JTE90_015466 [Oedothorax gibbosus]|uniref:Uncharacterized protein n=1 Tax=Oedothorax gibbosus TaxID=931172 RepID=A0AAV6UC72_9ARAC|nr:hypothetical protein JTE90_015466 [Oedothorax gibbosus]
MHLQYLKSTKIGHNQSTYEYFVRIIHEHCCWSKVLWQLIKNFQNFTAAVFRGKTFPGLSTLPGKLKLSLYDSALCARCLAVFLR